MAAPVKLDTKPDYSEPAIAVSLAITLLRKAKCNTWEEFIAAAKSQEETAVKAVQEFDLDDEQLRVLSENQKFLVLIAMSPSALPTFCDTCATVSLQAGTLAKKCINTRDCKGTVYKPAAATRVK